MTKTNTRDCLVSSPQSDSSTGIVSLEITEPVASSVLSEDETNDNVKTFKINIGESSGESSGGTEPETLNEITGFAAGIGPGVVNWGYIAFIVLLILACLLFLLFLFGKGKKKKAKVRKANISEE